MEKDKIFIPLYPLGAKEKNGNAMGKALITNYDTSKTKNKLVFINQQIRLNAFA